MVVWGAIGDTVHERGESRALVAHNLRIAGVRGPRSMQLLARLNPLRNIYEGINHLAYERFMTNYHSLIS
jgi:hypothetical protein